MLYLDLDGVLADFDSQLVHEGKRVLNDNSFLSKPESEWTPENIWLDRLVSNKMKEPGFWLSLPLMSDALSLFNYCKPFNPTILTAVPHNFPELNERIGNEKRQWVRDNLGDIPVIVCLRKEKINYIDWNRPLNILIDDMPKNIKEWNTAGGLGILHTSAEDSIKRLDHIIREMF